MLRVTERAAPQQSCLLIPLLSLALVGSSGQSHLKFQGGLWL